jgi:hypothetical protein
MVVTRENWQGENKTPKVKSLQHQVPFSARGTLPQRVAPEPDGPRARQMQLQHKKDKDSWLQVLQEHAQRGDFEVLRQAIRIEKTPESRPSRS